MVIDYATSILEKRQKWKKSKVQKRWGCYGN